VAVSLVLLVAAALFVRSVQHAETVDLGFDPSHVLNQSMDVSQQGYDEARGREFFRAVETRVRALPGVDSVSWAYSVPFGYYNSAEYVEPEGQPVPPDKRRPAAAYNMVGPEYFDVLKIAIVRGRAFTAQDDERARPVAIVNDMMAKMFWPGQDPIGKRFRMEGTDKRWLEVVGVTKTGKYNFIFEDPGPYFFAPIAQQYRPLRVLHVRTAGDPGGLAPLIQKEIRSINPDLPVYDVGSMERMLQGPNGFFLLRMGALFGGGLGALGLVLALVGIYGVVSYAANQRTQEIGVRKALGARRRDIVRQFLFEAIALTLTGGVIGILLAVLTSRVLLWLLPNLPSQIPPWAVVAGLAVSISVGLGFGVWPARRAAALDPVEALRYE
jgi:predicted permease